MRGTPTGGRTIKSGRAVDDQPVIIAVASYASTPAAQHDFGDVCSTRCGPAGQLTAAVVERGADGYLTMDRHHSAPSGAARGGELLAAALVVLAAPLGLRFLSSVMATRETLVAVACLAAHFWQNVPKSDLHRMATLLEARQAGLVVVSVGQTTAELGLLLSHADARIVSDT
jgi:hypothetical protein